MMKALRVSSLIVAFWLMASCAFAISPADSWVASGLKAAGSHQHITTQPCVVGGFLVTATSNGGFAQLITATTYGSGIEGTGLAGAHVITKTATINKILADVPQATANNSVYVDYGDNGMYSDGPLFLDCHSARAEVYYKE